MTDQLEINLGGIKVELTKNEATEIINKRLCAKPQAPRKKRVAKASVDVVLNKMPKNFAYTTTNELARKTDLSPKTVNRKIVELIEMGAIEKHGNGTASKYKLVKK